MGVSATISSLSRTVVVMSRARLRWYPLYGATIDVLLFCASFVFFAGAHGPAGPMFVLHVVNAPIAAIGVRFLSERTTTSYDLLFAFMEVAVCGALYGLIVAFCVAGWRAVSRRHPLR